MVVVQELVQDGVEDPKERGLGLSQPRPTCQTQGGVFVVQNLQHVVECHIHTEGNRIRQIGVSYIQRFIDEIALFVLAELNWLEGFVLWIVFCSEFPEDAEFIHCSVLDSTISASQLSGHDFAENSRQAHIELLKKLHDLVVITAFIKERPEGLDDVHAVSGLDQFVQLCQVAALFLVLDNLKKNANRDQYKGLAALFGA